MKGKYEKQLCNKRKSKVIAAEGEHKASRALRHAAEVIAESPSALQVNIEISCFKNDCPAFGFRFILFAFLLYLTTLLLGITYLHILLCMIAVAVSANVEQHQRREKLHNNLPGSN